VTLLAYQFALDPTPTQERALRSHAGAARVAFNWGLARVKANLSQREAEKSYGITGDDLTPDNTVDLVVAVLAAQGLERREGRDRAMVGRVQQGGVQHRAGPARPRPEELGGLPQGQAQG